MHKHSSKFLLILLSMAVLIFNGCAQSLNSSKINTNEETNKPDKVLKFTDQNSEDSPTGIWEHKFAELVKKIHEGAYTSKIIF